uniref:Uncharacterized protein n=1 Tax=Cynoglossus semilaevis TaxID=244447 RepID=A0A3P8WKQ1_CYNSE
KLGLYIGYFCCNCICVLFLRFNESVFLFLVYGFQNNLAPTSVSVLTTSGANVNANLGGYGVQKNVSGSGVVSSGVSTTTRSQAEETYKNRYVISDKENVSAKREAEMLILAKDSGKQFTTGGSSVHIGGGSISGDSIKKEKILSSYSETAPLKTETHGPYYGSGVVMKDKATYAGILISCSLFLHIYTLYSWYSELKSLKNQKVIPKYY